MLELQRRAGNAAVVSLQRLRAGGAAATTTADVAAAAINAWITANGPGGQAVNYCTGVLANGDLVISKVGGVTAATAYVRDTLRPWVLAQGYHTGRDIYLAQAFLSSVGSNHAEMCIVAAAGALGQAVTTIYCSGPHCGFCAALMTTAGVALGAAAGGDDQMGWTHPFAKLAYGQQLPSPPQQQLAELAGLPLQPQQHQVRHGMWLVSKSPRGRATAWL